MNNYLLSMMVMSISARWPRIVLSSSTWWLIPILILILGSVFVTMILALIRNLPSRSKAGKDYSEVLSLLGGKANIINVAQQGSRITLWVSDQSRCDYQKLKELGATGVFISGDTIKIMWPNEAQELANYLKKNVQEPQS
ncbi:MAG: hypothetical protein PHP61_00100 [Candidatus Izemoplasmatales bacterium]|nr:hypothetical protein [Candidatus Izemoplasmatales bacterium]MDD4354286.1 hypothetical protein [Candidatus Izemoplasmatales bacterium]